MVAHHFLKFTAATPNRVPEPVGNNHHDLLLTIFNVTNFVQTNRSSISYGTNFSAVSNSHQTPTGLRKGRKLLKNWAHCLQESIFNPLENIYIYIFLKSPVLIYLITRGLSLSLATCQTCGVIRSTLWSNLSVSNIFSGGLLWRRITFQFDYFFFSFFKICLCLCPVSNLILCCTQTRNKSFL